MRTPSYSHSQNLWALPAIVLPTVGLGAATALAAAKPEDRWWLLVLFIAVPMAVMLLLGRLRIRLDARRLEWQFGFVGVPRWGVDIAEIVSVEVIRTTWADGWGIRRGREGWLYNASGFGAVRIRTRDGRSIRLGSDEPGRLAAFITARLPRRR